MIRCYRPAASQQDLQQLLEAYLALFNPADSLKFLSLTLMPFDPGTVEGWMRGHEEQGVEYYGYVDRGGAIKGLVLIRVSPLEGFELLSLAVDPGHQGRGVGKSLASHAVKLAREGGHRSIQVKVFADNPRMLRLVIGLGFLPVGLSHRARADGADMVHFRRYL